MEEEDVEHHEHEALPVADVHHDLQRARGREELTAPLPILNAPQMICSASAKSHLKAVT